MVAVLTIAVGIGANTALFSVFDRLVLNPTTLPQSHSLVSLWVLQEQEHQLQRCTAVSWPRYGEIRDHATSFSSLADSAFDNYTSDPTTAN